MPNCTPIGSQLTSEKHTICSHATGYYSITKAQEEVKWRLIYAKLMKTGYCMYIQSPSASKFSFHTVFNWNAPSLNFPLQLISRNFDHKCAELRCEVRKFVAKFSELGIHKPIYKQSPWLVPEVKEANQMRRLQTGLWISLWTFELRNELANFATKFGTFVVKVSWNRLSSRLYVTCSPVPFQSLHQGNIIQYIHPLST